MICTIQTDLRPLAKKSYGRKEMDYNGADARGIKE